MKNVIQGSLITTFRCNAQCNMCNIWKFQTNPNEEIDASYYEKLPAGLRINITGGEPTLRKDIDKIFEILYPKSRLLELSTNGYNTQKIVELANKYPNILIRVSVEGLPKINDAKRGIKDGFDHALRTMLELKKTKCKNIGFSVVISPDNYMDLLHLYDLCVALDVELGNSAVHNSWYFHKEDNQIESEEALRQHELFVKALLTSKRRHFKDRLKDYGRAYFNRSIHRRLLENILASDKAKAAMEKVRNCKRNCTFIVTERHDMVRRPWVPIMWIIKNKWRTFKGKDICWD